MQGRESQVPSEYATGATATRSLHAIIDRLSPDVIVSCGWPNLHWVERLNVPVALDLTGPHLLERAYQAHQDVPANVAEKLAALAGADFYTCIGERQKYYFGAWLAQAGLTMGELSAALHVIPYSLDPAQPEHHWPQQWEDTDVRFVYGGIFLPWQDPSQALLTVGSTLDEMSKGVLVVVGGRHPFYPVDMGKYGPLL